MLLQQFQENLKTNFSQLSTASCKLLLAVSGGIDSTVMTDLFYKTGFDFTIAHCNFQLRDDESIRDELFVRSFEKKYNKEVLVKRFITKQYAEERKISIQEAARELRYEWFESIANGESSTVNTTAGILSHPSPFTIHYIATAHNSDDNIETMLMFFPGTR